MTLDTITMYSLIQEEMKQGALATFRGEQGPLEIVSGISAGKTFAIDAALRELPAGTTVVVLAPSKQAARVMYPDHDHLNKVPMGYAESAPFYSSVYVDSLTASTVVIFEDHLFWNSERLDSMLKSTLSKTQRVVLNSSPDHRLDRDLGVPGLKRITCASWESNPYLDVASLRKQKKSDPEKFARDYAAHLSRNPRHIQYPTQEGENNAPQLPRFPTALRKMYSAAEVQQWLDENVAPLFVAKPEPNNPSRVEIETWLQELVDHKGLAGFEIMSYDPVTGVLDCVLKPAKASEHHKLDVVLRRGEPFVTLLVR